MISFFAKYKRFGIAFLILSVIILYIIYSLLKTTPRLPIKQPTMINPALVDTSLADVKKHHRIANWELTNQNGKKVSQKTYKDKIYVADFFFTTCQTICPIMTEHMVKIQNELKNDSTVYLLSHTVTPQYDTPEILHQYAINKGVDSSKWNLVTGSKKEIYDLARKSYLAVTTQGDGDKYDMIHTENFMLIDKKSQIRGYYDGTDPEAIEQLLTDITYLKEEYLPKKTFLEKLFGRR